MRGEVKNRALENFFHFYDLDHLDTSEKVKTAVAWLLEKNHFTYGAVDIHVSIYYFYLSFY